MGWDFTYGVSKRVSMGQPLARSVRMPQEFGGVVTDVRESLSFWRKLLFNACPYDELVMFCRAKPRMSKPKLE